MESLGFLRTSATTAVPEDYLQGLIFDVLDNEGQSTAKIQTTNINRLVGIPSESAVDLLMFATAVYCADKKVLRRNTPDGWTRQIKLSIPVSTDLWRDAEPDLVSALSFLTSDHWSLEWRIETSKWHGRRHKKIPKFPADGIALFSGGVDSLVGAIDLLESGKKLVLVSHFENAVDANVQVQLGKLLTKHYGSDRLLHIRIQLGTVGHKDGPMYPLPTAREPTSRSRSIAFLALGLAVGYKIAPKIPLYVPENGFISLNVPLTLARLGSCSTRTTHPYFITTLLRALRKVGIIRPVINPYRFATKGEMLKNCLNQKVLQAALPRSISCAHPTAARWHHESPGNCGYCYPCLIRRSAAHSVGWDKIDKYKIDICKDDHLILDTKKGDDVRASAIALARQASTEPFPLLSGELDRNRVGDFLGVYKRGLEELKELLVDKASPAVRKILAI